MSIRISDIPLVTESYELTNKKIMVHDLAASSSANTVLVDIDRLGGNGVIVDGNKGDITIQSDVWTINDNAVTLSKLLKIDAYKLLGNPASGVNNVSVIGLSERLSFFNNNLDVVDNTSIQQINVFKDNSFIGAKSNINFITGLNTSVEITDDTNFINVTINATPNNLIADGNYNDLTVSGSGTVWTINDSSVGTNKLQNNSVTLPKLQQLNALKLIGNPTTTISNSVEVSLGSSLKFVGNSLSVSDDSSIQKIQVYSNNILVGSRKSLNFGVTNLNCNIIDDASNNRININLTGPNGSSIYANDLFVGAQPKINFVDSSSVNVVATLNSINQSVDISFTTTGIKSDSVFIDVKIGSAEADGLLLTEGTTTYTNNDLKFKNVIVVRNKIILNSKDLNDGEQFVIKAFDEGVLNFSQALMEGEDLKIISI